MTPLLMLQRIPITVRAMWNECQAALRFGGDAPSVVRLALDIVLYRVLRVIRLPNENRPRTIRLRSGERLTYRLNRGDIQSIREVFFGEVYRLPFSLQPRVVVDLLKIDIEGGEQALLDSDLAWLSRIGAIIAEFHPDVVDYESLVQRLVDHGFVYVPAGAAWPNQMDAFIRDDWMHEPDSSGIVASRQRHVRAGNQGTSDRVTEGCAGTSPDPTESGTPT